LVALFQVVASAAQEIGLDAAWSILERYVIEKRIDWWETHRAGWVGTDRPLLDAYRLFYEDYLRISAPEDGEIVSSSGCRLTMRWWNPCPALEACVQLGLDTRLVCRKVYHRPVEALVSRLVPTDAPYVLRFERNYAALRPYGPYCEESFVLEPKPQGEDG
jgi:hypothetical protein